MHSDGLKARIRLRALEIRIQPIGIKRIKIKVDWSNYSRQFAVGSLQCVV